MKWLKRVVYLLAFLVIAGAAAWVLGPRVPRDTTVRFQASAIGDDRLQREAQGYVVPDSFTHGTSEQRVHWFMKGYQTGDLGEGDTFDTDQL